MLDVTDVVVAINLNCVPIFKYISRCWFVFYVSSKPPHYIYNIV